MLSLHQDDVPPNHKLLPNLLEVVLFRDGPLEQRPRRSQCHIVVHTLSQQDELWTCLYSHLRFVSIWKPTSGQLVWLQRVFQLAPMFRSWWWNQSHTHMLVSIILTRLLLGNSMVHCWDTAKVFLILLLQGEYNHPSTSVWHFDVLIFSKQAEVYLQWGLLETMEARLHLSALYQGRDSPHLHPRVLSHHSRLGYLRL